MFGTPFDEGPRTLSERPPEHRRKRALALVAEFLRAVRKPSPLTQQPNFARKDRLLTPLRKTHAEFLPEQPRDRARTRADTRPPAFQPIRLGLLGGARSSPHAQPLSDGGL